MKNWFHWPVLTIAASAVALASCSTHPLPDDVSRYSTEDIVRNVRCEAKEAVRERIEQALLEVGLVGINPETVLADKRNFEIVKRANRQLAAKFIAYGASTITYKFDFDITENNDNSGSVTFAVPFTKGEFTLALGGKLNKERQGHRTFTTAESFEELVYLDCRNWLQPHRNFVYPLTGSIGMREVINAFIDVAELRGADKVFTDDIKFTTFVRGKINPALELTPVKNRFQVAAANANLESKRKDLHNVTVSLSFPDLKKVEAVRSLNTAMIPVIAAFTKERALINMCIADGEAREEKFGTLREISPKEYCLRNGELAPW